MQILIRRSNQSRRKYVWTCLVAGFIFFAVGALLVLPSTSYSVPGELSAQALQPEVEVYTQQRFQPILIQANFENSDNYTLEVMATTQANLNKGVAFDPSLHGRPVTFWLRIADPLSSFSWSGLHGMENMTAISLKQGRRVSAVTHMSTGNGTWAGFRGTISPSSPVAEVSFHPSANPWTTDGPYERVNLPIIDNTSDCYSNPDGSMEYVNGVHLYCTSLNTWVETSPWSYLNSNLQAVNIAPTPDEQAPLDFQGDRFLADILYRNTRWDQIAAIKVFLGGLIIGVGAGAIVMPIGLFQPADNDRRAVTENPDSPPPVRQRKPGNTTLSAIRKPASPQGGQAKITKSPALTDHWWLYRSIRSGRALAGRAAVRLRWARVRLGHWRR